MATAHALAVALDEYLALTSPNHAAIRMVEEFHRVCEFAPDTPPAVVTLARLRWEAEREIERLIALMDAIDGDIDLEPCDDDQSPEEYAGESDDSADDEPTLGSLVSIGTVGTNWDACRGLIADGEAEVENEHGGDVQDEPHDDDESCWKGACDISWPESAGRGPWFMPADAISDDDEDSDPANRNDDDNGLGDESGAHEQGFTPAWMINAVI